MHFKLAYLKLTAFYVGILMLISVAFSVAIYNISSQEINQGLGRQSRIMQNLDQSSPFFRDFDSARQDQLDQINSNMEQNLIYYNLIILIVSTIASYFFAKWTLRPLEESMEAQSRFTADASHELRTPLTAMRSEIEVSLRDQKLDLPESKKLLQSNLEEISKLESLATALLKLAEVDGQPMADFKTLPLGELITEAYQKVEPIAKAKSIEINYVQKDTLNIKGEKQSLIELLVIFFDNAIKYSPEKSKVDVSLYKDDGKAVISIRDHGGGIKASEIPHIFERFYRADQSRNKEKAEGYGLGLSIAKNIMDLHRGKIAVKSSPGKGTEFWLKFPLA